MSSAKRERPEIDVSLLDRVASLPPSGQRWLKAALEAIETIDPAAEQEEEAKRPPPAEMPPGPRRGVSLDDVLSGDADLSDQAEAYPDLVEELRDIAEIANLLQDAGRARRSLGEQILREQLLEDREPEEEREDQEDG